MVGTGSVEFGFAVLSSAFNTVHQGVAYYDASDRLRFWNTAYENAWTAPFGVKLRAGLTFEDIMRKLIASGAFPEAMGQAEPWLETRLAVRRQDWLVFERKNKCGQWVRLEQTRTPDGGLMCIAVDITALKEISTALEEALQKAQAATAAKSTFLATMSHEIRTPLNGVLGMAQAMSLDVLSEVQRDRLDVIRSSGESLLAILNDILDISKIEAGKLEIEKSVFDLPALAKGAYAAFTALANKKALSFALTIKTGSGGKYRGDSTRIRQILYNLIANGLKFTSVGEVRVDIGYDQGCLTLDVSDTGIGISPEAQRRLFEKFVQADCSTTRHYGGSGLGLAICKELTQLMNGTIAVSSEPGRGSTFTVVIPLERVSANETTTSRAAVESRVGEETATAPELPPVRVLAAEDNEINRLVLKTILHQLGIDPTLVHDGAEALATWESSRFDVILMDVQMPKMDGPTAARAIRVREAQTGRIRTPIIALTANVMSHQIESYRKSGMDGFVAKPLQISDLVSSLRAILEPDSAQAPAYPEAAVA